MRVLADLEAFRYPLNLEVSQGATLRDGSFSIAGIPPGKYVVVASTPAASGEPALWLQHPLLFSDQDISGLLIELKPAIKISGRVTLEGPLERSNPSLKGTRIIAESANGRLPGVLSRSVSAAVEADGHFVLPDLWPGDYVFRASGMPAGFGLKAVLAANLDASTTPLVIESGARPELLVTLSNQLAAVSGMVLDRAGQVDAEATVFLFPQDRRFWRNYGETSLHIQRAETNRSGRFSFKGVLPGSYLVLSLSNDLITFDWNSPANLMKYSKLAEPVQVGRADVAVTLRSQTFVKESRK